MTAICHADTHCKGRDDDWNSGAWGLIRIFSVLDFDDFESLTKGQCPHGRRLSSVVRGEKVLQVQVAGLHI